MSITVTTDVDVEVGLDDVLEETSTEELVEALEERLESENSRYDAIDFLLSDKQYSSENMRCYIERLCAPRGGSYVSKAEAKRIICELIDEVFFEV